MSDTVTVKYKTEKITCSCCRQTLPNPSGEMEFTISKSGAMDWTDWEDVIRYDGDCIDSIVDEYVHDTIYFHALNSNEHLIIEDSEIDKVQEFLIRMFSEKHDEQE